ncbi:hypothetical protein OPT61_g930 [Boeremia exigua]|uniref:Uncharacterized protein n=1 Tax=Boeremia exigua TaxID=749465 RepID=A0ACC2ISE8_9PLEO|nr:hypothetical protein OPT61_g930 [Boeremia exigua]
MQRSFGNMGWASPGLSTNACDVREKPMAVQASETCFSPGKRGTWRRGSIDGAKPSSMKAHDGAANAISERWCRYTHLEVYAYSRYDLSASSAFDRSAPRRTRGLAGRDGLRDGCALGRPLQQRGTYGATTLTTFIADVPASKVTIERTPQDSPSVDDHSDTLCTILASTSSNLMIIDVCRVALPEGIDSRAAGTGATCKGQGLKHRLCLVVVLTKLEAKKDAQFRDYKCPGIIDSQDPAAAKTWGRQEASRTPAKMPASWWDGRRSQPAVILAAAGRSGSVSASSMEPAGRQGWHTPAVESVTDEVSNVSLPAPSLLQSNRYVHRILPSMLPRHFIGTRLKTSSFGSMRTAMFSRIALTLAPATPRRIIIGDSRLRNHVAAPLRSHRSPGAAEPKSLVDRRRAGVIYQTGTARATARKEERIVAAKVPNVLDTKPSPSLPKAPRHSDVGLAIPEQTCVNP